MYSDEIDQVSYELSDDQPEPYENDLEELGNREAFEDAAADRESDGWNDWAAEHTGVDDDHDGDPFVAEPMEGPEF